MWLAYRTSLFTDDAIDIIYEFTGGIISKIFAPLVSLMHTGVGKI
jgi:hypothetical protein